MGMLPITVLLAFAISFIAKLLADQFLTSRVSFVGSFVGLQPSLNHGVAFSITFPGTFQWVFIAAALGCLIIASLYARTAMSRIAFGLLIGGALGNIIDRIPDGAVTDFFQVGTFPIFNVADSCISIGVAILAIEAFGQWMRRRRSP